MPIKEITIENFAEATKVLGVILLYFYKPGCPYCQRFDETFNKLHNTIPRAHYLRFNGMAARDFVKSKGILSFPALMLIKNKHIQEIIQGNEEERAFTKLAQKLHHLLSN